MNKLQKDITDILRRFRTGGHTTQADRRKILIKAAADLYACGFKPEFAHTLCPKHIKQLVTHWQLQGITPAVIKNRLSCLRWLLEKVDRLSIMPRSNDALGVERRCYVTNEDKSRSLDERLALVKCDYVRLALRAQQLFGLRREEAIKLSPCYSERGDRLVLKPSTTKGGVPRWVPIRTDEQRQLLREIRLLVGAGSLIPPDKMYHQQRNKYMRLTALAGFSGLHGLRHHYAQQRYQELTGMPPPVKGGRPWCEMDEDEQEQDKRARKKIARELGHKRVEITNTYLGSPFSITAK